MIEWLTAGRKVTLNVRPHPSNLLEAARCGVAMPQFGVVYTIRYAGEAFCNCGWLCLKLAEVCNPSVDFVCIQCGATGKGEPVWKWSNFRPVLDQRTDISELERVARDATLGFPLYDEGRPLVREGTR